MQFGLPIDPSPPRLTTLPRFASVVSRNSYHRTHCKVRQMKLSRILSALMLLAGPSATIFAREAELLDFTNSADTAPWMPGTPSVSGEAPHDPSGSREAVLNAMLSDPRAAIDRNFAGTAQAGIAPEQGDDVAAHAPGLAARQNCRGEPYTPTWWNHPETEQRRALYFGTVAQIACEFDLPRRLLDALIAQESGFNAYAVSRAGAAGMMQIMPGTARALGLSNPFDPAANLRAGAWYLRQQLDRFGRFDLALAAYNAGPERRSLREGRVPAIPETRHYVSIILKNWNRLIALDQQARKPASDRGVLTERAVHASGYRHPELTRFDGA